MCGRGHSRGREGSERAVTNRGNDQPAASNSIQAGDTTARMESDTPTSSSIRVASGARERAVFWVLIKGNRTVVTGGGVVVVILSMAALISVGPLDVGPGSKVATLFGSRLASGVATRRGTHRGTVDSQRPGGVPGVDRTDTVRQGVHPRGYAGGVKLGPAAGGHRDGR